jgi:hypothetical protein
MDYPGYRARGWLVGSGPVEAACERVVGRRMKGGGVRWGEAGADAVGHPRARFRREETRWDADRATPARTYGHGKLPTPKTLTPLASPR